MDDNNKKQSITDSTILTTNTHDAYRFTWGEKILLFKKSFLYTGLKLISLTLLVILFFKIDINNFSFFSTKEHIDVLAASKGFLWRPLKSFTWQDSNNVKNLRLPLEINNSSDENVIVRLGETKLTITQGTKTELYKSGSNLVSVVKKGHVFSEGDSSYFEVIERPEDLDWSNDGLQNVSAITFDSNTQSDWETQKWLGQITPYKRFFQNCFIKYYQENKGQVSGGGIKLNLDLSSNGTVKNVTLNDNDFSHDETFSSCIYDVAKRIQLNTSTNKNISFSFPLNFKLPDQR